MWNKEISVKYFMEGGWMVFPQKSFQGYDVFLGQIFN